MTILGQSSGARRDFIYYSCGRRGHMARTCRFARSAAQSSPSGRMTCYHCGQPGHIWRSCPQLRGQSQSRASGSQQIRILVLQSSQQQGQRPLVLSVPQTTFALTSQTGSSVPRDRDQPGSGLQ